MTDNSVNKIAKMVVIVLLLFALSSIVMAMGIGPSRQFIDYAPGETIEGEIIIINDAGEEFRAAIYPQGSLADAVEISTPLVDVASSEQMKKIQYNIHFPEQTPKPGEHKLELVVRQFPSDSQADEGATVSANIALISQIIVKVPYPGKYADSKLFIGGEEDIDTPVTFSVVIYNFGTEEIQEARAEINIYGPTMEKVAQLETEKKSVSSKEDERLEVAWNPDVEKGTYKAIATVHYDGKEHGLEQNFNLGMFVIDVSDISVENFRLGDVAKFDILLFNSWNKEIQDVYVEMTVENDAGKKMTEFKTAAIDIPSHEEGLLEAYWYTEGVAPGIYNVKLLVHYAGKITQKEYEFEVNTNSITRLGIVGQSITEEEKKEVTSKGVIILLILAVLVILIVMNLVWFYTLSRMMKKKGEDK